jgi:hypothetical protein
MREPAEIIETEVLAYLNEISTKEYFKLQDRYVEATEGENPIKDGIYSDRFIQWVYNSKVKK